MKTITAEELKKKMEQDPQLMVINVLVKDAYDNCHIKGSINVSFNDLPAQAQQWGKNTPLVLYCASQVCRSSSQAYALLENKGFTNLAVYEGGIQEWQQKGFPCGGACDRLVTV